METRFTVVLACAIAGSALTNPAWAINKCPQPDGSVAFQDAPCVGKGEVLTIRPASGRGTSPAQAPLTTAATKPLQPEAPSTSPPTQTTQAESQQAKSLLEKEADMCLAWYRPLLRDPHGAYYTNLAKEKRVFSMDLHATNGYGGYVIKRAACEIHNGNLNPAWTKNHAKWGGWAVD